MQYGQPIDDGETTWGHIPRLLGLYKFLPAKIYYEVPHSLLLIL